MIRPPSAVAVLALATACTATACSGSSGSASSGGGPGGVLGLTSHAGVVAACADVQTASTDHQAGDDASAADALQAAVVAFRKPPVDSAAAPIAAAVQAQVAAGNVAGGIAAATRYCATRGG